MQDRVTSPAAPGVCRVCAHPADRRFLAAARPFAAAGGGGAEPPLLCGELGCRMLFERAQALSRSEAELAFHLQGFGRARREEKRRDQIQRERREAEVREDAAAHAALARKRASDLQLVVPSGHRPSRRLPERRRRALAAHLDVIIAAAQAPPDPPPPRVLSDGAPPGPAPRLEADVASLSERLCGVCGGGCCTGGGERAYLKPETIRAVLAADPGLDAPTLRDAYLARVPRRTIEGSCIFHTRRGCGLPREMRSQTCNAFACGTLEQLWGGLASGGPVRSVSVVRRRLGLWQQRNLELDNPIVGAALLTPTRTRRLRAPPPERT